MSKQNDVIIQGVGSEAAVVTPDIPICRGVVHIVDQARTVRSTLGAGGVTMLPRCCLTRTIPQPSSNSCVAVCRYSQPPDCYPCHRTVSNESPQVLIPVELSASSSEQSVQAERQELSRVQGTNQQYQQQNRQQQGQSNMMGEQQQGGMMGGGQQQQGGFANAPRSFASQP